MKIIWTEKAEKQLDQIFEYISLPTLLYMLIERSVK